MTDRLEADRLSGVLRATLELSASQGYAGYNKHDGLNSGLLSALFGWGKWPRLLATQAVMRSPVNLRPLLGVPKTRNSKGIGLFANAYLDVWDAERRDDDLDEAKRLLDWLLENGASGFLGLSWGYPYPWQDAGFFAPRGFPNRVVTCWIGFAFVAAARTTEAPRYRDAAASIAEFLTRTPNVLHDDTDMKCYSYVPDSRVTWAVMDVPALVGALLAEAATVTEVPDADESRRLMNWVADKQTDYGGWFYTHPANDSHITHDNYHTAIILDCFDRYREATGDEQFDQVYWDGLDFYRKALFTESGAPRWMSDKTYPHDIHGAASAILCFARAGRREERFRVEAEKIIDWTLRNMYDSRGAFYYQVHRFHTRRFLLMRWANAWMSRALAYYLATA